MMRALLFLCLVGAAIYGFLVFTEDALKDPIQKTASLSKPSSLVHRAKD